MVELGPVAVKTGYVFDVVGCDAAGNVVSPVYDPTVPGYAQVGITAKIQAVKEKDLLAAEVWFNQAVQCAVNGGEIAAESETFSNLHIVAGF